MSFNALNVVIFCRSFRGGSVRFHLAQIPLKLFPALVALAANQLILEHVLCVACYAQRFGPRGIGHAGGLFLGLMSDALDADWQRYSILILQDDSNLASFNIIYILFLLNF